jgi:hypothetical protein
MRVRTQPSMVEAGITKAVTNENSKSDFDSHRIVNGVEHLIYRSDTDKEEGKG